MLSDEEIGTWLFDNDEIGLELLSDEEIKPDLTNTDVFKVELTSLRKLCPSSCFRGCEEQLALCHHEPRSDRRLDRQDFDGARGYDVTFVGLNKKEEEEGHLA